MILFRLFAQGWVGGVRLALCTVAAFSVLGLCASCAPRPRPLPFLYDPYYAALEGDGFSRLAEAARLAGFKLEPVAIPDSGLTAGFYSALDASRSKFVAVSPLFSREVVSALQKYPDKDFFFVDEVEGLPAPGSYPSPHLHVPRFSRAAALNRAGAACALALAHIPAEGGRGLAMLVPSSDEPATAASPSDNDEAAFLAGFRSAAPEGLVTRFPVAQPSNPDGGPAFLLARPGASVSSSASEQTKPAVVAILLGRYSPIWASRVSLRAIPYVAESSAMRVRNDPLMIGSLEVDPAAAFCEELEAARDGGKLGVTVAAEFKTGIAGKKMRGDPKPKSQEKM